MSGIEFSQINLTKINDCCKQSIKIYLAGNKKYKIKRLQGKDHERALAAFNNKWDKLNTENHELTYVR